MATVTLTHDDARQYDDYREAIAAHLAQDDCWHIDIGMPEQPIYIDGQSTPLQSAGHGLADALRWQVADAGGGYYPETVYGGGTVYDVHVDEDDEDGDTITLTDADLEVNIDWPEDIGEADADADNIVRLAAWAAALEIGPEGSEVLARRCREIADALDTLSR